MYRISVKSDFDQLYRYNIVITCAGYDSLGGQLYVDGVEKVYNEEFCEKIVKTPPPPPGFVKGEPITLECGEAESIHLIVYVVTTTLPEERTIKESPPFDLDVAVERDSQQIYHTIHSVNQWGGASINIKL